MATIKNQKKLGLALSGGGARGLAHIGVLKVLEELGISISYISGCSMGGLIGALYASGYSASKIEQIALQFTSIKELLNFIDRTPVRRGLIVGHRIRNFLSTLIREDYDIQETNIPLVVNAIDLYTSKEVNLVNGPLLDGIMSTIAVPGFFEPVKYQDCLLIDGGTLNNLPVNNLFNTGIDAILAVDVHPDLAKSEQRKNTFKISSFPIKLPDFFLDYYQSQLIMVRELTNRNLEKFPADIILRPEMSEDISLFLGFQRAKEIIASGENCARKNIESIYQLLD